MTTPKHCSRSARRLMRTTTIGAVAFTISASASSMAAADDGRTVDVYVEIAHAIAFALLTFVLRSQIIYAETVEALSYTSWKTRQEALEAGKEPR